MGAEGERFRGKFSNQQNDQNEQPTPQSEGTQGDSPVENVRRARFDCAVPKAPRSLYWIQRMLGGGMLPIEAVPVLEKQWMEYIKTLDKQALEETLKKSESRWEDHKDMQKRNVLTAYGEALLPALEEDMELIRAELRQRK
ncbi:MAG TPA: hypothetical protein VHT73_17850 [Thermodesulfobacteriota bacterium]|nr:hypothetical protein [Thermodesulfobacteriota bacterium]